MGDLMRNEIELGSGSPVWTLHEQVVPPSLCSHLTRRIDTEMCTAPNRGDQLGPTIVDTDDLDLLRCLWEHLHRLVPSHFEGHALVGPHPTLRLLRYDAIIDNADDALRHPLHADTPLGASGAYSRLTVLVYVNSSFVGGTIRFFGVAGSNREQHVDVQPLEGTVLVFDHRLRHCAAKVSQGTKHVVKLSVLYAMDAEVSTPEIRVSVAESDQNICRCIAAIVSRRSLAQHTFEFVGAKEDEFLALVAQVESTQERMALQAARARLLDFIIVHDLTSWPKDLVDRALMPMIVALSDPGPDSRLKLQAYRALDTATQLHGDERFLLLGETLMKDAADQDPHVRLAAVNAAFHLFPFEDCRGEIVKRVVNNDTSPAVRIRALKGLVELAERTGQHEMAEARDEAAHTLLEIYGDLLLHVASSPSSLVIAKAEFVTFGLAADGLQTVGLESSASTIAALAIQAMALLSASRLPPPASIRDAQHSEHASLLD